MDFFLFSLLVHLYSLFLASIGVVGEAKKAGKLLAVLCKRQTEIKNASLVGRGRGDERYPLIKDVADNSSLE